MFQRTIFLQLLSRKKIPFTHNFVFSAVADDVFWHIKNMKNNNNATSAYIIIKLLRLFIQMEKKRKKNMLIVALLITLSI